MGAKAFNAEERLGSVVVVMLVLLRLIQPSPTTDRANRTLVPAVVVFCC